MNANSSIKNNMGKYLVTGRSATGKTELWRELLSREITAYDGDKVPGLAGWTDLSTGKRIGADYPGDDHIGKFTWEWDSNVLHALLKDHDHVFLCGNADNAADYYASFDKIFILTLPETLHRQRIMQRTEHDYAKHPAVQEDVITGQQILLDHILAIGGVAIDSTPPVSQVADELIRLTT